MANTLKFGAGEWATKKGSTLAYNSENGNFKPLPFTFDRSTSATRVNKEGLIEVVSNNEPRIDFLNDSKGALLLEPSRSNLLTYSEDFSDASWNLKSNINLTAGIASPKGDNSAYLIEATVNEGYLQGAITGTASIDYIHSFYIKPINITGRVYLKQANGTLEELTLIDGWNRYETTSQGSTTIIRYGVTFENSGDSLHIWGAQLEEGSYATSYIPTQGSIGTRVAESCSQTPPSGIIGQTEGTVFLDFKFIAADGVRVLFTLDGGSNNKRIEFWTNEDVLNGFIGGSVNIQIGNTTITEGRYKAAIAYDELGNQAFYVNGVQIGVSSTPYTIANLDNLRFNVWSGGSIYKTSIKTNDVKIYNTRLSNAQLQALTS